MIKITIDDHLNVTTSCDDDYEGIVYSCLTPLLKRAVNDLNDAVNDDPDDDDAIELRNLLMSTLSTLNDADTTVRETY